MTRVGNPVVAARPHAAQAAHTSKVSHPSKAGGAKAPPAASEVAEPQVGHKNTKWVSLDDYLKSEQGKGHVADASHALFSKADGTIEATGRDNEQQDIGDCFWCSTFSTIAMHDKPLMREHVREVGTAADGSKLYGVVMFAKEGSDQASKFQRAANDVVHNDADGKPVRFTPVWVVVSDKVPVDKDGDIDASAIVVAGKKNKAVLGSFLSEKAAALFVGGKGYAELDKGGDAANVMEMMTGFPASTVDVGRDMDPVKDKALADQQFQQLLQASRNGQQFVLGTWGNNKPNAKKSLADQDSIQSILKYPQFTPDGKVATDGFFQKGFKFQDGTGEATHDKAKTTTRMGAGLVGDHDYAGIGAFEEGKYKGLGYDGTCPVIELRNPWGSIRPEEFSDGRKDDDGVVRGPWYTLRTLVGTLSVGGRPENERKSLEGIVAPKLPPGATSTFKLVDGETPAGASDGFERPAPSAFAATADLSGGTVRQSPAPAAAAADPSPSLWR
jgi:hypothetical protein